MLASTFQSELNYSISEIIQIRKGTPLRNPFSLLPNYDWRLPTYNATIAYCLLPSLQSGAIAEMIRQPAEHFRALGPLLPNVHLI